MNTVLSTVHPHVCGELHVCSLSHLVFLRFIPTCVGNCSGLVAFCPVSSVHPHVCGELICFNTALLDIAGSSPRVWGTAYVAQRHTQ